MLEYIKNIIPRIQQFSGQLSQIESFVDKPWVLFDANQNTHEYLFLRDHRLILSFNGKVTEGKWELLPTGKLLVNRVTDKLLLQHTYIDEGILLLMISGGNDLPFMLINEKVITDRDPIKYLRMVEASKLNYKIYETPDGILLNDSNSNTGNFQLGSEIRYDNGNKFSGILSMPKTKDFQILVNDGIVEEIYFLSKYASVYGVPLLVKSKQKGVILLGDFILNHAELPTRTHKKVFPEEYGYKLIVTDEKGQVTKIKRSDEGLFVAFVVWIIVMAIISIALILSTS